MRCTHKSPKSKAFCMACFSYCCGKTHDKGNSRKLRDGRLEQEAHGTPTLGKQRKVSGDLFALSL